MKVLKTYIGSIVLLAFVLPVLPTVAQTVNQGELYVSPGTDFSTYFDFDNSLDAVFYNDGDTAFYAHFNNDGVVDFFEGGYTRFQGALIQQLSGTGAIRLYDVLFSNSASLEAFRLSGQLEVSGQADFDRGVIDSRGYGGTLLFEEGADHIHASNAAYVMGFVLKQGAEDFTFPIGDGGYLRPSAVLGLGSYGRYESEYRLENSAAIAPHELREPHIERIDNHEYWVVNRLNGSDGALLELSWHISTTPSDLLAYVQREALVIVYWDSQQGRWTDLGGVVDWDNRTVTTYTDRSGIYTLAGLAGGHTDELEFFNGITPGGDGLNDFFQIAGIEGYPNNNVTLYNRWGAKVFEQPRYDNAGVAFRGFADGMGVVNRSEALPTGTYFYVVEFYGSNFPGRKVYTGYLYIH